MTLFEQTPDSQNTMDETSSTDLENTKSTESDLVKPNRLIPSSKSYLVAVCLSAIFGVMGVHHFYLGRYLEGIIDFTLFALTIYFYFTGQLGWAILFFFIDGIHTFVITIMLLVGAFKDGSGKTVCYPGQKLN